jgi:multidrug efflux pump subunit AcrA (membrane-fusion protein)
VEIECAKVENALSIPIHAVFNDEGRSYCYVDKQSSYEKREVSIGAQSKDWAQVLAGLKEGERVALSQPPSNEIIEKRGLSL